MLSGTGVQIEGLRETVRNLERLGVSTQDLKAAFKRIGATVVSKAQGSVPRKSGRLAGSIRPSNTKNKAVVRSGSAAVPYAGVINFGWPSRGIEATNFLTDAANSNADNAVHELETELQHLIARYGLK